MQEADESGYFAGVLVKKKIISSEKSCEKTIRKFDYRVGFTFLVFHNDGDRPLTNMEFQFRKSYEANRVSGIKVPDINDYLLSSEFKRLPGDGDPVGKLTEIYGRAQDAEANLLKNSLAVMNVARLEPKEKLILLLNVYAADKSNLPATYLSGIYKIDEVHYSLDETAKTLKVREPLGEKAARVLVPYGWASQ